MMMMMFCIRKTATPLPLIGQYYVSKNEIIFSNYCHKLGCEGLMIIIIGNGHNELNSNGMATSLGERKLWIQTC